MRVARAQQVAAGRQSTGEGLLLLWNRLSRLGGGKGDGARRRPDGVHRGEQSFSSVCLVEPDQVCVDDLRQEAFGFTRLDANRDQGSFGTGGVLGKSRSPLGLGEGSAEEGGRKDDDSPLGLRRGLLHLENEVAAGLEVPRLVDDLVLCGLEFGGDPLGPPTVGMVEGDEEVAAMRISSEGHFVGDRNEPNLSRHFETACSF